MVPYLTYIMSEAEYGVVTDLFSLIPFALVLLTMGLESGFFRFTGAASSEGERRDIFASTWGVTMLVAALFFAVVLLFSGHIAQWMRYGDNPSYVWLTALIVMLDVVTAMPFARLRQQRLRMRYVGISLAAVVVNLVMCFFFYTVLPQLASSVGGLWAKLWVPSFGAGYVLVANVFASAAALLMLIPSTEGIRPRIEPALLRRIMLYSLPLLISGIAGTANEFIDRQMIKWLMPEDISMGALGVYGATTKLAVIMVLFTQMYRFAAEPLFLASFKGDDFAVQSARSMKYYVIVTVVIFLGVMFFSDIIVMILGRRFRGGTDILPLLLVANALAGVVLNLSFWYKQKGRTWTAIWITGTGLLVTLALNIALIPRLGYVGAAWGRLACEVAMVGVSLWFNQKYAPAPYDFRRMALYILLGAALYGAGLLTESLAEWLKYVVNSFMLLLFIAFIGWREGFTYKYLAKR
jgi:O-antigen/teichoic acid export membrane protein